MFKFSPSKIAVFALTAIIVWLNFRYMTTAVISWDVFGYYLYLPALFIYNDLSLSDLSQLNAANDLYHMTPFYYQFCGTGTGANVNIYQAGMAVLYLPFFLIGHLIAYFTEFPQDGFSMPYKYALWIGGMIYSFIGLIYLRKVLLKFFDEFITVITLILIVIGTNYLLHSTIYASNLMTANFIFTLYAALLFYTIRWHEDHNMGNIIMLAIVSGLMFLARPVELLALIIPLLWNVKNGTELKHRWELIKSKKNQFIIFFIIFLGILSIQVIYTKMAAGEFFLSGYKSYGEDGFYIDEPHMFNVLFSFRKGWLVYTPLMIFAIIGIFQFRKRKPNLFIPFLVFTFLYIYAVSAWSNWWYAASFSQRALIQILPVMAIPLGFFINSFKEKNWIIKSGLALLILFFVVLNIFQSWQYTVGILNESRMTGAYYFKIFGKTQHVPGAEDLLLFDRNSIDESLPIDTIKYPFVKEIFEGYETPDFYRDTTFQGKGALLVNGDLYAIKKKIPMTEITEKEYALVEISFQIMPLEPIDLNQSFIVIHQKHHRKAQRYKSYDLAENNLVVNSWNRVVYNYTTAEVKRKKDIFEFYINNTGNKKFLIDNIRVRVHEKAN